MKITVIATGFDSARQTLREFVAPPQQQYNNNQQAQGSEDQNTNQQPVGDQNNQTPIPNNQGQNQDNDEEVWDIPAFLRQKN